MKIGDLEFEELCHNLPCQNPIVPNTEYCITCNKVSDLFKEWVAEGRNPDMFPQTVPPGEEGVEWARKEIERLKG